MKGTALMMKNKKGVLFVLSGPSGAGKGTLRSILFDKVSGLNYSISCTTRQPREGEVDGVDYRFIDEADFSQRVTREEFLEYAYVHGHYYGTLISDAESVLNRGEDLFLEIDVQGALQVKRRLPEAVLIFVAPPSLEILEERLRNRKTESNEDIALRMHNAREEMELRSHYDVVVVNDDLNRAAEELCSYVRRIRSEKLREEL